MSLSPLVPLALPYVAGVATGTAKTIAEGLDFAQTLLAGAPDVRREGADAARPETKTGYVFDLADRRDSFGLGELATNDSLHKQTLVRLRRFRDLLIQRLDDSKVDSQRPILVQSDIFGGVDRSVSADSSYSVGDIINRDPELRKAFQEIVKLANRMHRAEMTTTGGSVPFPNASSLSGELDSPLLSPVRIAIYNQRALIHVDRA